MSVFQNSEKNRKGGTPEVYTDERTDLGGLLKHVR